MRERIGKIATDAARAVGYFSAGTIEGGTRRRVLLPRDEYPGPVEHCVTEEITGSTSSGSRSRSPTARN